MRMRINLLYRELIGYDIHISDIRVSRRFCVLTGGVDTTRDMTTRRYCRACGIQANGAKCGSCGAPAVSSDQIKRFSWRHLTTKRAAQKAGITLVTLQRWIAASKVKAPKLQIVGGRAMRLWSADDFRRLCSKKAKIYKQGKGRKKKNP